ncbi:MAG: aminodeoxychorismate synthase component I [Colwellia sp.]|nr:aminodeoxychorismate synthase component I [Colwellia sp.]
MFTISAKPFIVDKSLDMKAIFSAFSDQPWAMWLDSCCNKKATAHVDSNFDIIVWQPEVTLTTHGENTEINWLKKSKIKNSNENPLILIEKIQQQCFSDAHIEAHHLPFKAGCVGYFAYDLGKRFEVLPQQTTEDISLAEMSVGIYFKALIFDHKKQMLWLVCPEHQRQSISLSIEEQLTQYVNTRKADDFSLLSAWQSNISKKSYDKKFQQVQDYLLSGDCYQINLAQRFHSQYQGDEFLAYCALREKNQAPFSAFLRFGDAAILSISPERFLQKRGNKVQSKPIKGTKPRSNNAETDQQNAIDLKHSEKDRAENLMIVDLLRNDISKVCIPGTVKVPSLFDIESFPAVHHLVSTVEGELAHPYKATDLLAASFPGGSITGAPKIRAMEIIDELEPHQRSIYCGSIGYISACGNMDTSITIRTLLCEKSNNSAKKDIYCWAGGGVVADSKVDCEYQETFDKVNKILPVLSAL